VTVVDRRADDRTAALLHRYPWLGGVCDLAPVTVDVEDPAFQRADVLSGGGSGPVTSVYVFLDDDVRGLRVALSLRRRLLRRTVPVVVGTRQRSSLSMAALGEALPPGVHLFEMLDRACTPEILRSGMNEVLARAMHDDYLRRERERGQTPDTNPSMVPWEALPETLRESNRDQAAHIGTKLRALRREIRPAVAEDRPETLRFTDEEVEALSRMEHDRWWREREAAGWTPGDVKDAEAKRSPYLIPWEELSEEKREVDREFVRALPLFLARVGFTIVAAEAEPAASPVRARRGP
jgi:hypothetical protein